ncbi:MAG: ComF family protein [bacterium]
MRKPFYSFLSHLLDILFPPVCILCGKHGLTDREPVCPECWAKATPIKNPVCIRCGLPIGSMEQSAPEGPYLCSICRQREWAFDMARAGFVFDGPVRDTCHMLKYKGHFGIGTWLGKKMGEALRSVLNQKNSEEEVFIIPVPLSPDRLKDREFNHSLCLAESISRDLGFPVVNTSILRRKNGTIPQVGLTPKERWSNVRGAFHIKGSESVKGKRIVLVDDVLTTGATSNECARMLKKAGAARVEVLTLARTL